MIPDGSAGGDTPASVVAARDADRDIDRHTALIVVDVQNDFVDPRGSLAIADAESIIATINQLVGRARAARATVVYTQDWHPEKTPHFQPFGGRWPVHCVAGTWGAELHRDLDVAGPVLQKGTGEEDGYSGFSVEHVPTGAHRPTGLHALLQQREVSRVVIVGLAEDVCVKETALDARRLGYRTAVVRAGTRPVDTSPGSGEHVLQTLRLAGVQIL